jgi:HK97 family phage major capsid protein
MKFTVSPFLVVLFAALVTQALPFVHVNAWNLGTEQLQPWRRRSSVMADAVRSMSRWFESLWLRRTVCAAALLALLAADLSHGHTAGGVLLATAGTLGATGTGDPAPPAPPTFLDVKKAIEDGNRLFNEFRTTNDARLKALEEGHAVDPLITAKLEKLNEAMDKQAKTNEDFIAVQTTVNRLEKMGFTPADDEKKAVENLRKFNLYTKALAAQHSRTAPAELDMKGYQAYCEAFDKYLRRGDRAIFEEERKALSVGTDPNGGWLVTPDMTGRMVQRVFETSPMRQYAGSQAISTDALEGVADLDEAAFEWVGEQTAPTEGTTPDVPQPWRIPVHEAAATPKATNKMLEDANTDVAAWLMKKVGDKIGRGFNSAFVIGNGVAKPRGFAAYDTVATPDASRDWGVFEHVKTGTSGGFGANTNGVDKMLDVIHAMKDAYAVRAAWYMNRTTLGAARQIKDANNQYVFIPSLIVGQQDQMLGYPVRKLQDMATYSTANALAIAFGDMEETYLIVDRLGVTVLVDPYTAKPYVVYYTRARVGGDVVNFESLKFLKFAA